MPDKNLMDLYLDGYERGIRTPTAEEIEQANTMIDHANANLMTDEELDNIDETIQQAMDNLTPDQESRLDRIGLNIRSRVKGYIDGLQQRRDS